MTITAKVICDSIANGIRLTTLELYYPRFLHSQFMTHRMFSRNASSSRAVPVFKTIDDILRDTAIPIHFGKNKKGMQADEECNELIQIDNDLSVGSWTREDAWLVAAENAIEMAEAFNKAGYHKQIVNRILEPFSHIKVICTATEWDGFFKLRLHDDAQPEIKRLAECMKEAMDNSIPARLKLGEWHIPYIKKEEFNCLLSTPMMGAWNGPVEDAIKCSTARLARVSYNNHDGSNPEIPRDIKLHDDLLSAGHLSPMEHCATPMDMDAIDVGVLSEWIIGDRELPEGITHADRSLNLWSGNLKGFLQYRQLLTNK